MDNIYLGTDIGLKRERNEDNIRFFKNKNTYIIVVADGMGGHPSGHIASKLVVEYTGRLFENYNTEFTIKESAEWLKKIVIEINDLILKESSNNNDYKGMGTTCLIALINKDYILVANVGDSRAYCIDIDDNLIQVTNDHTLVEELYRQGEINEEQLKEHPNKNILIQAIGTEKNIQADIFFVKKKYVKKLMLCTDGLTDMVAFSKIKKILNSQEKPEKIIENLINLANENGGIDNISVALWLNYTYEEICNDR